MKPIKAKGKRAPNGQCPIRPKLDGSQGNPMAFCTFKKGHCGPHSFEVKR